MKSEFIIREFSLRLFREATKKPCENCLPTNETELPPWFDEEKYRRGQQYVRDNQLGINYSQLAGLICLLAEMKGLKVLMSTNRSSTPETAKKRYAATIIHLALWQKTILLPGSESWESIKEVRRMHYYASISANKKNLGFINQAEMVITTFGFIGFALVRPKHFGLNCDKREDLEGFVHLWATLSYMLGIEDKYNCCLLELDAVRGFYQFLIRYLFLPLIQIETIMFKKMVKAVLNGLNDFCFMFNYEIQMFIIKSALGVPGYQYGHDVEEIIPCEDILTYEDILELRTLSLNNYDSLHHLSMKILLYDFNENEEKNSNENENLSEELILLKKFIQNQTDRKVRIQVIRNETEFRNNLNDSKFYELTPHQKRLIKMYDYTKIIYKFKLGKFIIDKLFAILHYFMRKHLKIKY